MSDGDDVCERYIREISQYPRISPEREMELAKIIHRSRDPEAVEAAVEELVQANLFLVLHCLKNFEKFLTLPGVHITTMDLIAEGNIALLTAARRYRYDYVSRTNGHHVRFSTYACGIIRNRMRRALKMARLIHVPEQHFAYWSKIRKLQEEYGDDVSEPLLMRELGVGLSTLRKLRHSMKSCISMLEDIAIEDSESRWADLFPSTTPSPDYEADRRDLRAFLQAEMEKLPPRTQRMIALVYLNDPGASLSDLSKQFGVSRERCRQILAKGLKRLRISLEAYRNRAMSAEDYFGVGASPYAVMLS